MSKMKNTPEFQKMMEEQELEAIAKARIAYDKAARELDIAMADYADAVTNLHEVLNEKE